MLDPGSISNLQTLLGAVAPVAVLTAEWFLRVGLVAAGEDVALEVALGRGDVDALGAVPALAGPRHLHVRHRVIVLQPGTWGQYFAM